MDKIKVGIVSFSDPRSVNLSEEYDNYNIRCEKELIEFLNKRGVEVISGYDNSMPVKNSNQVKEVIDKLRKNKIEAIILGVWKWTNPMFAVEVAKKSNVPVALVCKSDVEATGLGLMSAVGAAMWQIGRNRNLLYHKRFRDNYDELLKWIKGVTALIKLQNKSLLLWGGSYCLKMEHLTDDQSKLKSFLIGDIVNESEYILIKKAEKYLEDRKEIDEFIEWLKNEKVKIVKDGKMVTDETLAKQIALYLAAKERLKELREEGEDVIGVSVHCQPELSEVYGVTGCMLPSFLAFGRDHKGNKEEYPVACEGDIKGLLTSSILYLISEKIPLFGDIRDLMIGRKNLLVIGNCGGASPYYCKGCLKGKNNLEGLWLKPQCQGSAGSAVGFLSPEFGEVTIARLAKRGDKYTLHIGTGKSVETLAEYIEKFKWGTTWPNTAFDVNMDFDSFVKNAVSNHYSVIPGIYEKELRYFAEYAGIETKKLDEEP